MHLKLTSLFLGWALLSGCQTTAKVPNWYLNPIAANETQLVAVGQGSSLENAKQKAISAVNQQLWTQVQSTGLSRNIANDINGREHYQQLNDFSVNTQTSALILSGVSFTKAEQSGDTFYVEASVNKATIKSQLRADIAQYNAAAQFELDRLAQTDPLVWWLKNNNTAELEAKMASRQSMLYALSPAEKQKVTANVIPALKAKVVDVHSGLKVAVLAEPSDKWMSEAVTHYLNQNKISVVKHGGEAHSHELVLDSDWRKNYVADIYISTVQVNITVKNQQQLVIASNEIIANANSVTSFERADEGASRHFSAKLKAQNFWGALGL
ncbi:LPP20 family lipoprotein [Shewanella sp. 1CM18E]|uniref:LPP20 family lipoprotein n=1 Tax=Shewanella sp. 1CM18E TaxID=2929169 RepID=UPI0020BDCBE3|nr:LPP20 family lipoprotein [Shewanella sp. 1CM18E]MCK8046837.1 LPP20 family lipoprotein [Shewanella sp. 1CM18E]